MIEDRAWLLYCEDTAGDMDVRDDWNQLPSRVQEMYIKKAAATNDYTQCSCSSFVWVTEEEYKRMYQLPCTEDLEDE